MHEAEPAAAAEAGGRDREVRGRRDRRALPPIFFLQERGLALLREYFQHLENVAQGRDYAVYSQRFNRQLGQRIGRHRRATNGLRRNELDEYFRPLLDAARTAEWNLALDSYDQTEAARDAHRLNLLRRNGARLLRAHLDILIKDDDVGRDYEEHEGRVVDAILARYIFGAAHLQRPELGRHYARVLPGAQRRLWLQLLDRYDRGLDADSTSGSASSDEQGG